MESFFSRCRSQETAQCARERGPSEGRVSGVTQTQNLEEQLVHFSAHFHSFHQEDEQLILSSDDIKIQSPAGRITSFTSAHRLLHSKRIMSRNYLSRGNELRRGDYLMSNNNQWKAVFQDDGNFVIYGWKPVWASDTYRSDAVRLVMQADCNLVMYNETGVPKWDTKTYTNERSTCRLQLTDDGKLVLYKEAKQIWST